MKFTVFGGSRAYLSVNDIMSQHRAEQAVIKAAFYTIIAELREDAHLKGAPVRGRPTFRRYIRTPLVAYYVIDGARVKIKLFRYSRP